MLNHVVFAQPDNKSAIDLLARTYDQMGYMAEAATWRNSYLTAAAELRNGPPKKGIDRSYLIECSGKRRLSVSLMPWPQVSTARPRRIRISRLTW